MLDIILSTSELSSIRFNRANGLVGAPIAYWFPEAGSIQA